MSNNLERRLAYATTLTTQAAVTADGNSQAAPVTIKDPTGGVVFELDLTAAAAASGDTLDVTVQTSVDGTNWVDVVHFTQALGNGGAKRFYAKLSCTEPMTMFENGTALAAAAVRHIVGDRWCVKWAIADGGAHGQAFSFTVYAVPM